MKNNLIVFSLFLVLPLFTNAQNKNWRQSHLNKDANYYDIVNSQQERISVLKTNTDRKSKKEVKQFERWAEYWKYRIMPDGSFVSSQHLYNEWLKEKEAASVSKSALANNFSKLAGDPWTFLGPSTPPTSDIFFYPGMGRVNAIAISPTDVNIMYAGSPGGGIWKTTNGGTTWTAKGDNLPVMGISDIVIDPSNENIIYIATGDFDGGQTPSLGVFKSTDGGDNWVATGLSAAANATFVVAKLLIDPNNTSTILATTKGAIKRSTDGGATWTDAINSPGVIFNDLQYKTGSTTTIYATSSEGKFLKSTDNGVSFPIESTVISSLRIDIAQTAANANLILALDSNGTIHKSTNEGTSWTNNIATIGTYDSQQEYNQEIAISPINENLVIVGGVNGWRSTNGGVAWELYLDGYWSTGQPYFYVHSDHHEMKFLPGTNTMINGNDGGVFKGDASGSTPWTDLSPGLAITQYYNVSGTPQDANKLILGAQDNDVAVYNGATFVGQNPGSDGVEGLWDYTNSNIAWSCSQAGILERTMDGFTNTTQLTTPAGAPFVWQLEIHPTVPTTIYGGFQDINKSTNRGDSWTSLNSGITASITGIAIAQSNADIIYVSGGNELKKTTNGGTSWTDVSLPQAGTVKDVVIHPTNTNEIYICYSGYAAGKVYKSTNGGSNWTNISGSLPNIPCLKMEYKTGATELFLATDLGVYFISDTITSWTKLDNGLPNVIVTDLSIHYTTNKLRVSTLGRGLWEVSIDNLSLGNVDYNMEASNVSIYPNPTTDKTINLELNNINGNTEVLIYNVIGSVIKNFNTLKLKKSINLSQFAQGVYFVKISNKGKSITKKVILK